MKRKATITLEKEQEKFVEKITIEEKNNKINYQEKSNTNVLFDKNNLILIRENNEIYMELSFKEKTALVFIKDLRKNIEMKLKSVKTNITEKELAISYVLENEKYLYKIEMED